VQTRKVIATFGKLAISAVLIAFLFYKAASDPQFGELIGGPKNWALLLCALPICLFAVCTRSGACAS